MKKMKYIIPSIGVIILLIYIFFILLPSRTLIFSPEKSTYNVSEFEEVYLNSEYYVEDFKYENIYNYMPEKYSKKYDAYLIEMVGNEEYQYFYYCKEKLYKISSVGTKNNIVEFAIADINKDGYKEIYCIYGGNKGKSMVVYDKLSNTCLNYTVVYPYVKFNSESNNLNILCYQDEEMNYLCDTIEIIANPRKFKFESYECYLESENYNVKLKIYDKLDENLARYYQSELNFPVIFKFLEVSFVIDVEMTYLGEPFVYDSMSSTKQIAAEPIFINGDNKIKYRGGGQEITYNYETGGVYSSSYYYYFEYFYENIVCGKYDLVVDFFGEQVIVEDFLVVESN